MTELKRCRYAVIKYAHDPLRHELVNVGVVIWQVMDPSDALWRFDSSLKRVERLYPSANAKAVATALGAARHLIEADPGALLTGIGGAGSIILSEPRAVRCVDMDVEIADLYETLVAPAEADSDEPREASRSAKFLKNRMKYVFRGLGVLGALQTDEQAQKLRVVAGKSGVKHTFDFAYENGAVHRIDALSFDYGTSAERISRARSFANLVGDVGSDDVVIEAVIQPPTDDINLEVYRAARKILDTVRAETVEVATDADLEAYCKRTKQQLQAHAQ